MFEKITKVIPMETTDDNVIPFVIDESNVIPMIADDRNVIPMICDEVDFGVYRDGKWITTQNKTTKQLVDILFKRGE